MSTGLVVTVVLETLLIVGVAGDCPNTPTPRNPTQPPTACVAGYYLYTRYYKPSQQEYDSADNVARAMLGQPQRVPMAPPPSRPQQPYVVQPQQPQPQYVPRYR